MGKGEGKPCRHRVKCGSFGINSPIRARKNDRCKEDIHANPIKRTPLERKRKREKKKKPNPMPCGNEERNPEKHKKMNCTRQGKLEKGIILEARDSG